MGPGASKKSRLGEFWTFLKFGLREPTARDHMGISTTHRKAIRPIDWLLRAVDANERSHMCIRL